MSRAKLFNMIKSRGTKENGRNPFDLSNMHVYSEKCMKINPVKVIDTIPKDYMDVDVRSFIQSNGPLNTAAFVRGRHELAAYYVPYNTIWHNYNQYQATREDPESALLKSKGISYEPRFAIWELYKAALAFYCEFVYCNYLAIVNDSNYQSAVLSYYGTNYYNILTQMARTTFWNEKISTTTGSTGFMVNYFHEQYPAFYAKLTTTEDNFDIYDELPIERRAFACDINGVPAWCDVLRKFDMLGYGNIYPYIKVAEVQIQSLLSNFESKQRSYADSDDAFGRTDIAAYFEAVIEDVLAPLVNDLKKISSATVLTSTTVDSATVYVGTYEYLNVYPLFAYNRCFKDMFRNTVYDINYDVRNFNCDFVTCTSLAGSVIHPHDLPCRFWKLESHQYEKDMFTGILPDTQFGAVSGVDISNITLSGSASLTGTTGFDYNRWDNSDGTPVVNSASVNVSSSPNNLFAGGHYIRHDHLINASASVSANANALQAFDVLALRRAECLQQYRMDLLRSGNKTKDIFKQIYGSNPKSMIDEAPYFIDVCGADINVNPIMATADTGAGENGSLGDIAGRVLVDNSGSFKFSTEDFGCIIFLSYTVVRSMYNSFRINPHRMNLTPEQHFIPELQNLGFEPIIREMLSNASPANVRHSVLGYSLPYLEFKSDIDEAHGNFVDMYVDHSTDLETSPYNRNRQYQGENSIWVVTRTDMQMDNTMRLRNFYGDPRVLDNVMKVQSGVDYSSDQFICHTGFAVKSVRQLSELGLPRF